MQFIVKLRILLSFFGVLLAFFLAEVTLRLIAYATPPQEHFQYFWSKLFLERRPSGAASGIPHEEVLLRATYGDEIDFATTHYTNNLGFIDHRNYHMDSERLVRIVIAGDSYTAGIGARPWVPRLAEKIEAQHPVQLFNFGMVGTGIENMQLLLHEFRESLGITDVVLLIIEDDFARTLWYPVADGNHFWFCTESQTPPACMQQSPHVLLEEESFYIPSNLPLATPNDRTVMPEAASAHQSRSYRQFLSPLIKASELLTALNDRRQAYLARERSQQDVYLPRRFPQNYAALQQIIATYGKQHVTVVRFPAKTEVVRGHYEFNSRAKIEPLVGNYIDIWPHCPLALDDYHEHDHHFTEAGYRKFATCVEKLVLRPIIETAVKKTAAR